MYNFFLQFHSGLRWLVLLAGVFIVVKSIIGLLSNANYSKLDKIGTIAYVMFLRVQFLVGIVLYFFLSPYTSRFTFNMSDPVERFWAVEHILLMIFSIGAAEMGNKISKNSDDDVVKFRFQSILFGISLILILIGIPWNRL